MASQKTFSPELIDKVSYSPAPLPGELILHVPDPTFASIPWKHSSLGSMDGLAPELMHQILELLDFQSILRFARASRKGRAIVQGLPAYREMLEHAPKVLVTLGKTKLIRCHSAALLRQMLRTSRCAECSAVAPFLSLPTCERLCVRCIQDTHSLRMISVDDHLDWGIPEEHLGRIHLLHTIPGTHGAEERVLPHKVYRLAPLRRVREWLDQQFPDREFPFQHIFAYHRILDYAVMRIRFRRTHMFDIATVTSFPLMDFDSMSCIRMPFLGSSGQQEARLCKGCQVVRDLHSGGTLPRRVLGEIVPEGGRPKLLLSELAARLHLPEALLDHLKDCYGVRVLINSGKDGS